MELFPDRSKVRAKNCGVQSTAEPNEAKFIRQSKEPEGVCPTNEKELKQ